MKVVVFGGRDFNHYGILEMAMKQLPRKPTLIIHGGARGADTLAGVYAIRNNIPFKVYPALWDMHGKTAGFIRNQQMLDDGTPDYYVALPGGNGTADMLKRCKLRLGDNGVIVK